MCTGDVCVCMNPTKVMWLRMEPVCILIGSVRTSHSRKPIKHIFDSINKLVDKYDFSENFFVLISTVVLSVIHEYIESEKLVLRWDVAFGNK